jgi:hypothetical protein
MYVCIWRCIQKFPDWIDYEIYAYNNKHSLRSNTKCYGDKTHQTDSQNSDTTAPNGRELYHLHFSLQAASPETFGYTVICMNKPYACCNSYLLFIYTHTHMKRWILLDIFSRTLGWGIEWAPLSSVIKSFMVFILSLNKLTSSAWRWRVSFTLQQLYPPREESPVTLTTTFELHTKGVCVLCYTVICVTVHKNVNISTAFCEPVGL